MSVTAPVGGFVLDVLSLAKLEGPCALPLCSRWPSGVDIIPHILYTPGPGYSSELSKGLG